MSIFPTKILLATDGSEEASLAATAAAKLATRTGSELHVLTVGPEYPYYELPDYPARFEEVVEAQRRETKEVLDEQVRKIEESGGTVEGSAPRDGHSARPGHRSPWRRVGGWSHRRRRQGPWPNETSRDGQRLKQRRPSRPLPGSGCNGGKGVTICRAGSCSPSTVQRIHRRLPGRP